MNRTELKLQIDKCCVIVVNYNAGQCLEDCVTALLECGFPHITVIDNASEDDSIEKIHSSEGRLQVIKNQKNVGFAAACNQGILATTSDFLLFLNPDCILHRNAVEQLFCTLQSSSQTGMVGACLIGLDGEEQRGSRRKFPDPKNTVVRAFGLNFLARLGANNFDLNTTLLPKYPIEIDAVSGACMLVKRAAINDVGLWDEEYFLHCEDLDWCMRFHRKGWKIMFVPDAKVTHVGGACSRSRPIFVEWHKHKGMIRFYRKFYKNRYPVVLWPTIVLAVWARFSALAGYYLMRRLLSRPGLSGG